MNENFKTIKKRFSVFFTHDERKKNFKFEELNYLNCLRYRKIDVAKKTKVKEHSNIYISNNVSNKQKKKNEEFHDKFNYLIDDFISLIVNNIRR